MGICDSTPKTKNIVKTQQVNQGNQGINMGTPQQNRFVQANSMNNPNEEAYYQEIGLCKNFGNDFGPKEKIQLNVGIRNALNATSYSVEIYMAYDANGSDKILLEKTKNETCTSNDGALNFSLSLLMDYFFEKQQYLFIIVRKNNQSFDINSTLGRVMGSRGQTLLLPLPNGASEQLMLAANTVKNNNISVCLLMAVSSMMPGPNVFFFLIKKAKSGSNSNNSQQDFWKIQKSEVRQLTSTPTQYSPLKIPAMFLCNGDYDHPIVIEFHNASDRTIIGAYQTTVNKLLAERMFQVGNLQINCNSELKKEYTFIDFLRGGTQLSLSIGIDFTGSNGNPNDSDSLHKIGRDGKPNQYQLATRSCGDILAYYDYDQTFPVYGYGAVLPNSGGAVSHCFPLNENPQDPNVKSIDGVLEVYRNVMPTLTFSGPTYFAPLINQVINNIRNSLNPNVYHILLILTDGMINDMDDTISALVQASFMPMSVIIVGVGTGDFGNMDILDADGKGLSDRYGKKAARDLVQFVPFYKYASNGAKLAEQVLGEVPRQLCDFYRSINQPPGDPVINI